MSKQAQERFADFTSIYVIESLGNEIKTGKELYDDIIRNRCIQQDLGHEFYSVESKNDLLQLLLFLHKKCTIGEKPIIHFEMHGYEALLNFNRESFEDFDGVELKNGDRVSWLDLSPYLIKLNIACGNNLFLTWAVCGGFNSILTSHIIERAPFWAVFGPKSIVHNINTLESYSYFYNELIQTFDIDCAIELHRIHNNKDGEYVIRFSEQIFMFSYAKFLYDMSNEPNYFRKMVLKYCLDKNITFDREDKLLEFEINYELTFKGKIKSSFYEKKEKYLMIDMFENNKERFQNCNWENLMHFYKIASGGNDFKII